MPLKIDQLLRIENFKYVKDILDDDQFDSRLSGFPNVPAFGNRFRFWLMDGSHQREVLYAYLVRKQLNGTLRSIMHFRPCAEGIPGYVHAGALGAIMDTMMGSNAVNHMVGGVTLRLEVEYLRPVPLLFDDSPHLRGIGFILQMESRILKLEGRKTYLYGEAYGPIASECPISSQQLAASGDDETGESSGFFSQVAGIPRENGVESMVKPKTLDRVVYIRSRSLFLNSMSSGKKNRIPAELGDSGNVLSYDKDLHSKMETTRMESRKFGKRILEGIVSAQPQPNYPITIERMLNDRIIDPTKRFVDVDWVEKMKSDGIWSHDTQKVMELTQPCGVSGEGSLHYIRQNGKLRMEYFTSTIGTEFLFVAVYQFTGWCMGPPGSVHGGCLLSCHDDAATAALMLHHARITGKPSGPIHARTVKVGLNYRKFTPLDQTYYLEVKMNRHMNDIVTFNSRLLTPSQQDASSWILHNDAEVELKVVKNVHGKM